MIVEAISPVEFQAVQVGDHTEVRYFYIPMIDTYHDSAYLYKQRPNQLIFNLLKGYTDYDFNLLDLARQVPDNSDIDIPYIHDIKDIPDKIWDVVEAKTTIPRDVLKFLSAIPGYCLKQYDYNQLTPEQQEICDNYGDCMVRFSEYGTGTTIRTKQGETVDHYEKWLQVRGPELAKEYAIVIDPSSTSAGVCIMDCIERKPRWLLNFTRGLEEANDSSSMIDHFKEWLNFTLSVFKSDRYGKIVAVVCELPVILPGKQESGAVLKRILNDIKSISKAHGIRFISKPIQTWKSFYLEPVRYQYGIAKLNDSNKEYVRRRGEDRYPGLNLLKGQKAKGNLKKTDGQDAFDALGIAECYLANDYNTSGKLRISPGTKSYKSIKVEIHPAITNPTAKQIGMDEMLKNLLDFHSSLGKDRKIVEFEFCNKMSIEDNIKTCVEINEHDLYYSVIPISKEIMKDLYRYGVSLPRISTRTKVVVVGCKKN